MKARNILARLGVFDNAIGPRLSLYADSEWVLANLAGEIRGSEPDVPMRLYLDAWIAKKLGARVAVINHSIEATSEQLNAILRFLYPKLDAVFVRDQMSLEFLRRISVNCANVHVAPDAVILFNPDPDGLPASSEVASTGNIGLTINAGAAYDQFDDWIELGRCLARLGRPLVFVSNEYAADVEFARRLARKIPLHVQPIALGFQEYCRLLSTLSVVVSNRLHTIVLATVCGVPSVPIEPGAFKMRGSIECLGLPLQTISVGDKKWVELAVAAAEKALQERTAKGKLLLQSAIGAREKIEQSYHQVLSPASKCG